MPVIPKTFYAAGLNYAEHVTEMAKKRGEEPKLPPDADIGYRANNALIAHGENIVIPKDAGELVQYEAELVAVIGKQVEEPVRERGAGLRVRLDDRQRHERAHLAARRPHACGAPRTPTRSSRWGRGSRPISTSTRPRRSSGSTARSPTISAPTT